MTILAASRARDAQDNRPVHRVKVVMEHVVFDVRVIVLVQPFHCLGFGLHLSGGLVGARQYRGILAGLIGEGSGAVGRGIQWVGSSAIKRSALGSGFIIHAQQCA
ncbi:hypothetical protein [Pelagibacterium sediminicola]|uniref:hypothetical protein n=1 Tax=Pelagibacterium sediminicola TaxID=2248761 RepID=UPI001300B4DE|nr:hypothetical protein [Pelagibacterium sediminicola]